MRRLLALSLCVFCTPATAQDLTFSPAATESCLAAAPELLQQEVCVGRSATACMEDTVGGETTVGMGGCLDRELAYWDARLNAAYQALMAANKADDAEMKELGATVPSLSKTLREMQRSWIPYKDATCDYERAQWGGGTGGGPATLHCLMTLTGAQALRLEARLNAYEGR